MLIPSEAMRRVRRLRLAAPDEGRARRGLRLVDDALRIASLPDAAGRLLIVRKLALTFAADASPQTVSLKLEALVAALQPQAVHAASPGASRAAAVWFRDPPEAHALAALRLAAHAPLDAWFWPLALPALGLAGGSREKLRAVLLSLAARAEAPAALPELARRLVAAGHARELIACLDAADADLLLAAAAWPQTPARTDTNTAAISGERRLSRAALRVAATAGMPAADARVQCVAALLVAAEGVPSSSPFPGTPHAAPAGASEAEASRTSIDIPAAGTAPAPARSDAGGDVVPQPRPVGHAPAPAAGAGVAGSRENACETRPSGTAAEAPRAPAGAARPAPLAQDAWPAGEPTAAGGLLFLLPVLARLGWDEWLDAAPGWREQHLERRLFALLCARLALAQDDPAWRLAAPRPRAKAPRAFLAPLCWRGIADGRGERPDGGGRVYDASGRLLLRADARGSIGLPDAVAGAWLTACRRWLRRHAGLGLASLVLRPARLSLTATHADVEFGLSDTDLAVRRAGLDIDPGWLAWYRRVVHYHYKATPWT